MTYFSLNIVYEYNIQRHYLILWFSEIGHFLKGKKKEEKERHVTDQKSMGLETKRIYSNSLPPTSFMTLNKYLTTFLPRFPYS